MHAVATKTADGVEFNVLQTEIIGKRPGGSPVDLTIDRFKNPGATVTQTNLVVANQPAVRLRVKAEGVAAEFILLRSSNSDYMLAVQSRPPNLSSPRLEADIERFFESFKILDSAE
jgi:hypothetical protein